jgi:hypothetical protein
MHLAIGKESFVNVDAINIDTGMHIESSTVPISRYNLHR